MPKFSAETSWWKHHTDVGRHFLDDVSVSPIPVSLEIATSNIDPIGTFVPHAVYQWMSHTASFFTAKPVKWSMSKDDVTLTKPTGT